MAKSMIERAFAPRVDPAASGIMAVVSPADKAALPILKNRANEVRLLNHILDRLRLADVERAQRIKRITDTDMQISGSVVLDKEERKRDRDNKAGKKPKPVSHNLPLADAQITEMVTYMMSVMAPDTGIFEAVAPKQIQPVAKALAATFNKQGKRGQYYRQVVKFCQNALRYNFAAMTCYHEEYMGIKFTAANGGGVDKTNDVVWAGNVLHTEDTYNFLYDTSHHPVDLPTKGEFFATVEAITPHYARRLANEKRLFGVNRFANPLAAAMNANMVNNAQWRFFRNHAQIRGDGSSAQAENWIAKLGGVAEDSRPFLEHINIIIWLVPADFGLSDSKDVELWRIKTVNGMFIGYAQKLEDTHGMLPVVVAAPLEDDLGNEQRTYAEKLTPIQQFGSFLMNTHQDAVRKSVYGLTIYNPAAFPGIDKTQESLFCGVIPLRASGTDVDIDKVFRHYDAAPGTDGNIDMIGKLNEIAQKIAPTDMLKQVTDLDRATRFQAAATVQAGNRRNYLSVRMMIDQAFNVLVIMMIANTIAQGEAISYVDDATGQTVQVTSSQLVAVEDLETYIGTGLRGLDKLQIIDFYTMMLNSILQSPQAYAEFDVIQLMNYISSVAGDYTDMAQFARAPDQRNAILQAQSGGAKPATQSPAGEQQAQTGAPAATAGGTR